MGTAEPESAPPSEREPDALYQQNRVVARVLEPQVDEAGKQIRFTEVFKSDDLVIPDECDFQKYKIQIQHIDYATKVDKASLTKGRTLRGVTADILGYRAQ